MPTGTVRQPRAWVSCGGGMINVEECEVTLVRSSGSGSHYEAVMALDEESNPGAAFWSSGSITASIIGTNGDGATSTLITGPVIEVEIDFHDRKVRIQGTDDTQSAATTRTDENFTNQQTTDVVQQIAGRFGWGVQTDGGGSMAGRTFDGQNYCYITNNDSCWDAIQAMAAQDGKIAFLDGQNTLYYITPGDLNNGTFEVVYTPPSAEGYETSNVMSLVCHRDPQIDGGVAAQASSWDTRQQQPYNVQTGGGQGGIGHA